MSQPFFKPHLILLLLLLLGLAACEQARPTDPELSEMGTTLSLRVTHSADDAEERASGGVNRSSSDLELTLSRGAAQTVGLRFGGLTVPVGATVTDAYLQFTADESGAGAASLSVRAEAADNATSFSGKRNNISARALTRARVTWSPPAWNAGDAGAAQRSPGLAALVQEVVDRPGWRSGNAVAFVISGTGLRVAESFDGDAERAAALHVEYSVSGDTPQPDPEPTPEPEPAPSGSNIDFPVRAAFYYPWFPETWTVNGQHVAYTPALNYYDSSDQAVVDAHIWALDHAKVDVAVASWWGPDTHKEAFRIPLLMERTQAHGSELKWALYYEKEGFGDPNLSELKSDLAYIKATYVNDTYAVVDGKPVLFVYNADDTSCAVADRWRSATLGEWYLVLKVFSGYRACSSQPDAWHQYAPAVAADHQEGQSYAVSPGFWRADESAPRLTRDLERFRQDVRDMVASGEPWQLITTFNEWGEGTAIEEADAWGRAYLEVLAADGVGGESPAPEPAPPPSESARFAAAGDFGGRDDRAGVAMNDLKTRDAAAFLLLGDISYDEITPESRWCDWVHSYVGRDFPFEVLAGNHEEDSRMDGHIRNFAACMPDKLGSDLGPGGYGVNYAFDLGPVTVVATSPDLEVDGTLYRYGDGSPEGRWLVERIRAAQAEGDWVVIGLHKNCITMGAKSCEIGEVFAQRLIDEGVDLVLQGHDHTYQRSHALVKVEANRVPAGAVGDAGGDGQYVRGSGTVFVVVGTLGRSLYTCSHGDAEANYFATHYCAEESASAKGYLLFDVSAARLSARFVSTQGDYADAFSIE